jgi:hypothetical protein
LSGTDVEYAVGQMVRVGRADRVLLLVSIAQHNGQDIPTETLLSLLESIVAGNVENTPHRGDNWGYRLLDLVKDLQKRPDADDKRLAAAEWALLPLFRFQDASPETLHRWLAADPEFFVELLRCAYRSKNDPVSEEPPSELAAQRAKHAFDLLHSWERLPGTDGNGVVNAEALREWADAARRLAEASGHLGVCDITLGELFAKSGLGADGAWPCEAVRRVLEAGVSDRMKKGFKTGIFNSVGVVTKAPHEGGRQERERADRYDAWAKTIEITSPLTAALLRRAAERFREDGKREDEEAEWDG